jgi:Zn-dependent protease
MQPDIIFGLVILIISVILHEVAHGYMANWLGDPTARLQGRLTLNPVSHIDPVGSILLPLILTLTHSPFLIGYAKPVPYNPYNLQGKYDEGLVAFAGPGTNILIAVVFGLLVRFAGAALSPALVSACTIIVIVNLVLAAFNLIPIPPLDGSKVLGSIFEAISGRLAQGYENFTINFQRLGLLPMLLIVYAVFFLVLQPYFVGFLGWALRLLTGLSV